MKKFIFQAIGLIILIVAGLLITKNQDFLNNFLREKNLPTTKVQIKETIISAQISDDVNEKSKGLSGRDSLASNSGMLFVYSTPEIRRFWMKGMRFPIDIIWVRSNKVVDILLDAKSPEKDTPDSKLTIYQPNEPVDKVLEVNSGFVNANSISIGDDVIVDQVTR